MQQGSIYNALSEGGTTDALDHTDRGQVGPDDDEHYFSDDDPMDLTAPLNIGLPSTDGDQPIKRIRRMTRDDANSIVGGDTVNLNQQEYGDDDAMEISEGITPFNSQKVFSFSLPFGGFSSIKEKLLGFRFDPHLPILGKDSNDDVRDEMDLKLQRQQSISTLEDSEYFKKKRGTDNVRLRAVKKSLASNLNEMLPEFIHKKPNEDWEAIYDELEGNVVVMGGYRGSVLRDAKTDKRVWIPFKAGFYLRKINLLLGPSQADEAEAHKYIYPDGVLKNVGPVDICKRLIRRLECNPKVNCKEFGYDWRLSGPYLSKQFAAFLEENYRETGKPTLVIAHSMGGMIAHGALQMNPKLFRSVVYVGLPTECLNILGPVRYGDSVLLSDKILTFETNFMMRSSYLFLPLSGRAFMNPETNEFFDLDYFDPDTWVEYNLNPLVAKRRLLNDTPRSLSPLFESFPSINSISSKLKNYRTRSIHRKSKPAFLGDTSSSFSGSTLLSPKKDTSGYSSEGTPPRSPQPSGEEPNDKLSFTFSQAYNFLKETLAVTKKFLLGLEYNEELACEYPPLAIVYGNRVPSVRFSIVKNEDDIRDGDYYNFNYGHGDGVIHQKWLLPEKRGFLYYDPETCEGEIVGKFASKYGHVSLMTDAKAMANALSAVFEAEKTWDQKKAKQRRNRGINLKTT